MYLHNAECPFSIKHWPFILYSLVRTIYEILNTKFLNYEILTFSKAAWFWLMESIFRA